MSYPEKKHFLPVKIVSEVCRSHTLTDEVPSRGNSIRVQSGIKKLILYIYAEYVSIYKHIPYIFYVYICGIYICNTYMMYMMILYVYICCIYMHLFNIVCIHVKYFL